MSQADQAQLAISLAESYTKLLSTVEKFKLDTVIYDSPSWQIRDILWHIAVWDRQVTKSIRAYQDGSRYAIPDFDEDEFNQRAYLDGIKLTEELLLDECNRVRQDFQQAVVNFPIGEYTSHILYPWGDESGDITTLVNYMVEHDEEHTEEIIRVMKPK
jgi:hypothetical protein